MPTIYRYPLFKGSCHVDTGALPCPRCRSENIKTESSPAAGTMVTCTKCWGRSDLEGWNDGEIRLERVDGQSYFAYCTPKKFQRPPSDVVVKTTRAKALKMCSASEASESR